MIAVLRLGERPERDHRINTHLALVARAFRADRLIMFFRDTALQSSMDGVGKNFGGDFQVMVEDGRSLRGVLREWDGIVVHLTMYGLGLDEGIHRIEREHQGRDILIIVGGEKVPAEVYQRSDLNISVGNQPHSEVSALAVFLDRLFRGEELRREMPGWKHRIIPQERGKKMIGSD